MALNTSEMKHFLDNKHNTVAEAARWLPAYAHKYAVEALADNKALATKNLPADARKFYQEQRAQAEEGLRKTDAMIREIRAAAKDTHLSGESVDKLARQNAAALVSSGLSQDIANDIAKALSPYIKGVVVQGTSGGTTRTVPPTAGR